MGLSPRQTGERTTHFLPAPLSLLLLYRTDAPGLVAKHRAGARWRAWRPLHRDEEPGAMGATLQELSGETFLSRDKTDGPGCAGVCRSAEQHAGVTTHCWGKRLWTKVSRGPGEKPPAGC